MIGPNIFKKVAMACVATACLMTGTARAETVLTFCYGTYPPYSLGSGAIPSGGLKVELLDEVTSRIDGIRAVVVLRPWRRCLAQVKAGEADGTLPLFRSPEREAYLAFTDGTFQQKNTFWYNRRRYPDGLEWGDGFFGVAHLRLGMVNGSIIDQEMEAAFERNNRIVRSRGAHNLMQMLVYDGLDLIAIDEAVGRYHVTRNGWQDRIAVANIPISSKYSHFGLSRVSGADAYLAEFNRVIAELQEDGTIAEILGSTDYTH